jgi:glycerophosphoryl diester phosphodiesterase
MTLFHEINAAYREALRYAAPFTLVHLALRLLTAAVILPASGLVLAAALAMNGQTAMTDQDIARFLLTPAGFAGVLAIIGLSIIASALDLTVMTNTLRRGEHRAIAALTSGLSLVLARFTALFRLGVRLALRLFLVATPFGVAAAGIAWVMLRDYDINYYLTDQPPAFLVAAGLIGALAVVMAAVLIAQLARWAVALHFLLFQRVAPKDAFALSAEGLHGQQWHLIRQVLAWLLVRLLLASLIATLGGLLIAGTQELFERHLQLIVISTLAILAAWWLADAMVSALANGALAVLLLERYQRVAGEPAAMAIRDDSPATQVRAGWVLILFASAVTLVLGGIDFTGDRLERVGIEREVEIIAHRGAAGTRPENTLAAVEKALEDQADWVEIDVQETADGEVVVAHDSDFMKQAGVKLKVWNATLADLAEIDIGSWFDPAYAAERPPTLRQVLLAAKDRGRVLIELKYYGHDVELEQRVAGIVDDTAMNDQVAAMSLKRPGVAKMQQLRPDWPHGILAATAIGKLAAVKADFLALNTGQITVALVRQAQAQGKKVYAWTVDEPVTMVRLISMGIDGLITNEPALARAVMQARNELSTLERLVLWLTDQFDLDRLERAGDLRDA